MTKLEDMTPEERRRYDRYITWMRLTHNGRRSRADMHPDDQMEYDAFQREKL